MNRILVFIHYNSLSSLDDYVVHWLKALRPLYKHIFLVSNSPLDKSHLEKLANLYDQYRERDNIGYDFGAAKDVLLSLDKGFLEEFDWLTIMNDTCFGPLFPLEEAFNKMETGGADFWGMTDHQETYRRCGKKLEYLPYHIQSYFLSFNKRVFTDSSFWEFWQNIQNHSLVDEVVRRYEIGLTQTLLKEGFKGEALVDTAQIPSSQPNLSLHNRLELFRKNLPTIKIRSFFKKEWYNNFSINKLIKKDADYPFELIDTYFKKHILPHAYAKKIDKYLPLHTVAPLSAIPKIAFHIHLYYPELFRELLNKLITDIKIPVDVYITVRPELDITGLIPEDTGFLAIKSIKIIPNLGREIYPWFALAPVLAQYELVCHLHSRRSPAIDEIGSFWNNFIYDSLCANYEPIINEFINYPDLGIVIPDIPHCLKISPIYNTTQILDRMEKIWSGFSGKPFNSESFKDSLLFSQGGTCWYRPKALEKLFAFSFNEKDIVEPLPGDSVLQAIERLLVYAAWENGYDFRIMPTQGYNHMDKGVSFVESLPKLFQKDELSYYEKRAAKAMFNFRYQGGQK